MSSDLRLPHSRELQTLVEYTLLLNSNLLEQFRDRRSTPDIQAFRVVQRRGVDLLISQIVGTPSQPDVYQMMAYAHVYRASRLTLLYPHHSGLGSDGSVHARHRITGHEAVLETASIDIARRDNVLERLRQLIAPDQVARSAAE
jgi:hypothetical protein